MESLAKDEKNEPLKPKVIDKVLLSEVITDEFLFGDFIPIEPKIAKNFVKNKQRLGRLGISVDTELQSN